MRRNKKFYVYMMLFVVLIAQLACSGWTMAGTPEPVGAAVHNAGNAQADSTVATY